MAIQTTVVYEGQKKIDTLDSKIRIEEGNGRILVSDGTKNRILIGKAPDGSYGIWVSKEGFDVLTDVFS